MHLLALIKPQFEAQGKHSKGGIIRDAAVHRQVCDDIAAFAASAMMSIVFSVINFVVGVNRQGLWTETGFLVGGVLVAWLHIRYWRGLPPFRRRPPPPSKKKSHLRVV